MNYKAFPRQLWVCVERFTVGHTHMSTSSVWQASTPSNTAQCCSEININRLPPSWQQDAVYHSTLFTFICCVLLLALHVHRDSNATFKMKGLNSGLCYHACIHASHFYLSQTVLTCQAFWIIQPISAKSGWNRIVTGGKYALLSGLITNDQRVKSFPRPIRLLFQSRVM